MNEILLTVMKYIDHMEKERNVRVLVFLMCLSLLQMNFIYREIQEYENG